MSAADFLILLEEVGKPTGLSGPGLWNLAQKHPVFVAYCAVCVGPGLDFGQGRLRRGSAERYVERYVCIS